MKERNQPDRRHFLKGSLAAAGIALGVPAHGPFLTRLAAEAARKGKRCLVLWLDGGLSHIDTLDMKPNAPAEIRGELKPIQTNVPGIDICELLPRLARQADKLAIIRSMTHPWPHASMAIYLMHTAYRQGPHWSHPELGAMIAKYRGDADSDLPNFIRIGPENKLVTAHSYPGAGFLGPVYQPLRLSSYQAAQEEKLKKACDIAGDRDLKRYGDSDFGKNCLAARRLLEAGVPFVEVQHPGYDLHDKIFGGLRPLLPVLDAVWSALLEDLHDRGLLQDTLVVCTGEYGRTPRINAMAGRDHWSAAWSLALAGGGIRGGRVYGATDGRGAEVKDNPVTPGDLFATIYRVLGIDATVTHPCGTRMIRATPEGAKPVTEILVH